MVRFPTEGVVMDFGEVRGWTAPGGRGTFEARSKDGGLYEENDDGPRSQPEPYIDASISFSDPSLASLV